MPNLDPWINQNTARNNFENCLLSIKDERQKMIHPNSHPNYNERHQKNYRMRHILGFVTIDLTNHFHNSFN